MSYIIIWRNNHREPILETDHREFLSDFSTFEEAKEYAEEMMKDNPKSEVHFDYAIYEETKS